MDEWKGFFGKSRSKWDTNDRGKGELYRFFVKHCIRMEDFLLFYPCLDPICAHCVEIRAHTTCPNLLKQLDFQGGSFFCPVDAGENHFKTFLELFDSVDDYSRPLKTGNGAILSYCDDCKCWPFFSMEERKRHWKIVHDETPTKSFLSGQYPCNFLQPDNRICGLTFDTEKQRRDHKDLMNHRKCRVRKQDVNEPKEKCGKKSKKRYKEKPEKTGSDKKKDVKLKKNSGSERAEVGKRVRVWYGAEHGRISKYFTGVISVDCGNDLFEMKWDDKRAKKHEIVFLSPADRTDDESNENRWNYL